MTHNLECAGEPWDEMVWVDNGSQDGVRDFMSSLRPDVVVLNKENLGVAVGYNRAMVLARCDYLVITGCDMLMPTEWLTTFKSYLRAIPETGVACMYAGPVTAFPERIRGDARPRQVNGLPVIDALPMGRRMWSREMLGTIGYLREDFGLYGWEDVEWARRAERICELSGKLCYVIPDQIAKHLGTAGVEEYDGQDEAAYHAFKKAEAGDPAKHRLMEECERRGYPYYNPFS